jgi:hypothetical protein
MYQKCFNPRRAKSSAGVRSVFCSSRRPMLSAIRHHEVDRCGRTITAAIQIWVQEVGGSNPLPNQELHAGCLSHERSSSRISMGVPVPRQASDELEATGARLEAPALRMGADDEASLATRPAKVHTAAQQDCSIVGRPKPLDPDVLIRWIYSPQAGALVVMVPMGPERWGPDLRNG